MTRRTVVLLGLTLALAGAGVSAAALMHVGPWRPRDLGPVMARVDGRPVYLSQARARTQGLTSVHGDIAVALGPTWPEKVLQSLVDDVIIQEEAERRGIALSPDDLSAAVAQVRGDFPSEDEFGRWLESQHMDLAELERRMSLNLLAARVYLAVTRPVEVTPAEIRDYYRKHRTDYEEDDRTVPLLEVRTTIRDTLEKQEKDAAFADWLDARREAAKVDVIIDDWWRSV